MQRDDFHRGRYYLTTLCMTMALIMATAVIPREVVAGEATLSWNPNPEIDLAGYKVYYGTQSGNYSDVINVGNVTTYVISGLPEGNTYYFVATAFDTSGNESGYSNEVSKTLADTTPPVISAILATNISSSSAVISWSTDEPATSQVQYGTTTGYGSTTTLGASLVTSHSQTVIGLQSSTLYHYRVWSVDEDGNVAISADNTLMTVAAPDSTPPVILDILASNITGTSATITWTTDELSDSRVEYGTTTAYGSSPAIDTAMVTVHSQELTGLFVSTTYNFRVLSRDAAGNLATSGNFTFSTSTAPDTTPPVIFDILASNITGTSAVITWATDEAATSEVDYGTTTAYGFSSAGTTLVTSHSRALSGLTPSTTYHYRVKSRDGAGNLVASGNFTFTTSAASDTTPPEDVQDFTALGGNQQITLSWANPPDPDFLGVRIRYRTDRFPVGINDGVLLGDFTGQPTENVSTTHAGLQNGVTYYYAASSYDLAGNYQSTVRASATPSSINQYNQPTAGGGCGMIKPRDGGSPPVADGSGQFLLKLLPSYLLILLVGLLKWFKKVPSFLKRACHVCLYPEVPIPALSCVRSAVLLDAFSLGWGGHTLLERQ